MAWQDREKEWEILEATQRALGEVCMVWAALDRLLDHILMAMLDLGEHQTAIITTTIREIPPRCTMIERLLITFEFDDDWSDWLSSIMVLLRDDLGPKRNRYVHDRWLVDASGMTKIDRQVKTPKPQSRQKRQIQFDTSEAVSIEQLTWWCSVGHATGLCVRDAIQDIRLWNLSQRVPTAHKQSSAHLLAELRQ